jgi:hypothetical protein
MVHGCVADDGHVAKLAATDRSGRQQIGDQCADSLANTCGQLAPPLGLQGELDARHDIAAMLGLGVELAAYAEHPAGGQIEKLSGQRGRTQVHGHAPSPGRGVNTNGVSSARMTVSHCSMASVRSVRGPMPAGQTPPGGQLIRAQQLAFEARGRKIAASTRTRHPLHRPAPPQGNSTP